MDLKLVDLAIGKYKNSYAVYGKYRGYRGLNLDNPFTDEIVKVISPCYTTYQRCFRWGLMKAFSSKYKK